MNVFDLVTPPPRARDCEDFGFSNASLTVLCGDTLGFAAVMPPLGPNGTRAAWPLDDDARPGYSGRNKCRYRSGAAFYYRTTLCTAGQYPLLPVRISSSMCKEAAA